MVQTLFHQDAYLTDFQAVVTACRAQEDAYWIALDNTAFYDTSGGQPNDTGTLDQAQVLDVIKENGVIWHRTDRPLAVGAAVQGHVDWPRRFDHMCQHAADHMIAGMLWQKYGATTIGLHTGQQISSIDVDMHALEPKLTRAQMDEIELLVMQQIQRDVPIRCWFPDPQEIASLPLRKAPTVKENVRVVQIGDYECVACGGTHPSSAGQIGLIKIVSCQPNRGNMRLFFLAGQRAYRYFQQLQNATDSVCALLSTNPEALYAHVEGILSQRQQAQQALAQLQTQQALAQADTLIQSALPCGEIRTAVGTFDSLPETALRELASKLIDQQSDLAVALFSKGAEKTLVVFACGKAVPFKMGNLLRETLAVFGGRGGGKPDFAMGSLPAKADIQEAAAVFRQKIAAL